MNENNGKSATSIWYDLPREFEWRLFLGNHRRPVTNGMFVSSLSVISNLGEKWGDTYIRDVGLHYDDYSNWESKQRLYPIHGNNLYINSEYELRKFKDAAGGVTGLIGEVLTVTFLQKILNIPPYHIAHIKQTSKMKSPDLLVQLKKEGLINAISFKKYNNDEILTNLVNYPFSCPFPLECKSRRYGASRLRDALIQLVDYWKIVNSSAGFGMVALINLIPKTSLDILVFLPRDNKQLDIMNVINSTLVSKNGDVIQFTEKSFFDNLRGYFLE